MVIDACENHEMSKNMKITQYIYYIYKVLNVSIYFDKNQHLLWKPSTKLSILIIFNEDC